MTPTPTSAATITDWQPIETAPKDGRLMLLWDASNPDGYVVARWARDDRRPGPFGPFVWLSGHVRYGERLAEQIPTHWMPLPAPPEDRP